MNSGQLPTIWRVAGALASSVNRGEGGEREGEWKAYKLRDPRTWCLRRDAAAYVLNAAMTMDTAPRGQAATSFLQMVCRPEKSAVAAWMPRCHRSAPLTFDTSRRGPGATRFEAEYAMGRTTPCRLFMIRMSTSTSQLSSSSCFCLFSFSGADLSTPTPFPRL